MLRQKFSDGHHAIDQCHESDSCGGSPDREPDTPVDLVGNPGLVIGPRRDRLDAYEPR